MRDIEMPDFKLIHGIYESVINHALEERLSRLEENYAITKNQLDSEESSFTLALHLTKLIANSLAGIKGDDGVSSSYCFLGPAKYVSHSGSKPINITWQLLYKMPARLCRMTERMAIA